MDKIEIIEAKLKKIQQKIDQAKPENKAKISEYRIFGRTILIKVQYEGVKSKWVKGPGK